MMVLVRKCAEMDLLMLTNMESSKLSDWSSAAEVQANKMHHINYRALECITVRRALSV
jgi:hypothetical protein